MFLTACGYNGSSTPAAPPTSGVAKRVFLSDAGTLARQGAGSTYIIDAAIDQISGFRIGTVGNPEIMQSVPAQSITMIYEGETNLVQFVDISTESVLGAVTLGGRTESLAVQTDARFAYAPIRNLSRVDKIDVVNRTVNSITGLTQPRRVVLSPNNAKLLVFSDDSDSVRVVNTADNTVQPAIAGFDRAYTTVFLDNDHALVLSCGAECGGTQAKVSVLDLTTNIITGEVNVEGATVGLLDGNTLYVAGNRVDPGGAFVPRLNIVNTTNLTVSQSAVTVHDGLHTLMALGSNGRLFIGGSGCTGSCLTIYNTTAQSAVQSTRPGPVASILPITGRQVVYVVENGDLGIYDTNTDALQTRQITITGAVSVMNEVD